MPKPDDEEKMLTTTLRLPTEWHDYLRDRAHEERTSIAKLIRKALEEQFGLKEPPRECRA